MSFKLITSYKLTYLLKNVYIIFECKTKIIMRIVENEVHKAMEKYQIVLSFKHNKHRVAPLEMIYIHELRSQ